MTGSNTDDQHGQILVIDFCPMIYNVQQSSFISLIFEFCSGYSFVFLLRFVEPLTVFL